MIDKVEDTLRGGYGGLFGEVVTADTYRLKQLKFVPDVIIDLGANVGVFTRYARSLFPEAIIIAVEPDADNFFNLVKFTPHDNIIFINKAIGTDMIWRCEQDINGAHESYLSSGLGYPFKVGELMPKIVETEIECIMPDDLIRNYVGSGKKSIIKMDIEGNENIVFTHVPSMNALKLMDYITMEVHLNALSGDLLREVRDETLKAFDYFAGTHNYSYNHPMFYALKKEYGYTAQKSVS